MAKTIKVILSSCPFCGGTASAIPMANQTMVSVGCDNTFDCGARMSRSVGRHETLDDCAAALANRWNRRAEIGK